MGIGVLYRGGSSLESGTAVYTTMDMAQGTNITQQHVQVIPEVNQSAFSGLDT